MSNDEVEVAGNGEEFLTRLQKSGLLEKEALIRVMRALKIGSAQSLTDPKEFANHLVTAGLLTPWQALLILKGKYRGFIIGKYKLLRPLGSGGMGAVYEAEHLVLNNRVAIKVLPQDRAQKESAVKRFMGEAKAAAKLDHPNVVRALDFDVVDNKYFIVMEMVDGENLANLVLRGGPLSYVTTIGFVRQAAAGLGFAHDNGIIHRDIKPANLLIDRASTLKVADLGLAWFQMEHQQNLTSDGKNSILGTVDYVAPEQAWNSHSVDRRTDIYSLGCTMYFMLTGNPPFSEGSLSQKLAMHQTIAPKPVRTLRPECPEQVDQLCMWMLRKQPKERPQAMRDVINACEQILHGSLAGSGATGSFGQSQSPNQLGSFRPPTFGNSPSMGGINPMSGFSGSGSSVPQEYRPPGQMVNAHSAVPGSYSQVGDLSNGGWAGAPGVDLSQVGGFPQQTIPMQAPSYPTSQPAQRVKQKPSATAATSAGNFYGSAVAAKAKPKKSSGGADMSFSKENMQMLAVFVGITVAFLSIGLTAWQIFGKKEEKSSPVIKGYEDGSKGITIIQQPD